MLQVALLCLLVGQVPPPPAPPPPEIYSQAPSSPADQLPPSNNPQAQREGLLVHFIVDMQAQGKYDAQKYREVERMVNNMTASQLGVLVQYYQERKAQVGAWQEAQAEENLRHLEAYRDYLKRELEWKSAVRQQEQVITAYTSALAAQQAQWAMQNFYAAQAWPYYFQPYAVYRPFYNALYPYHHHHW